MYRFLKMQVYVSALLSIVPFLKPEDRSIAALLWLPKLLAGALSTIVGITGGVGAVVGLIRRDWKLAGAGFLGAGLAARFLREIPAPEGPFEAAFGADWADRVPDALRLPATEQVPAIEQVPATKQVPAAQRAQRRARRWSLPAGAPGDAQLQRDVVYGQSPASGRALLADLWQPPAGTPRTGLGVIYVHGGAWRIGDKDMGTRTFFRRLAGLGHTILDISYTLWPEADLPTMVTEVKQAIVWLKENGPAHGVDGERIVLMGGSAGGHLALLAAYTPDHPAFQPAPDAGDTSVHGVVAYYPAVDFLTMPIQGGPRQPASHGVFDKVADAMMERLFRLYAEDVEARVGGAIRFDNFAAALLGGRADEIPDTYRLLSPIYHVGAHCPPTLLLQGSDDVFGLTPGVRRLHKVLEEAAIPTVLVEYPHSDHGFDLILPQVSPLAKAATLDVARFLALLA